LPSLIETVRIQEGRIPLERLHLARLERSCRALGLPSPEGLPFEGLGDAIGRFEVSAAGVSFSSRPWTRPSAISLAVVPQPHRPYPHKTTEREQFDRAEEAAREAGADEPLLLTAEGEIAECARWGVLWWEGEEVCGPALALGVLPGVGRARIKELMGSIGERRVKLEAVMRRAIFLTNAARGVVPVASIDGVSVPQSPATARLAADFWA
jgi:branched-subunit amino acid aminotransferase/4-amino-4-deoxychorismate lyase